MNQTFLDYSTFLDIFGVQKHGETTLTIRNFYFTTPVGMVSLLNSVAFNLSGSDILCIERQLFAVLEVFRKDRGDSYDRVKYLELEDLYLNLRYYAEREREWRKANGFNFIEQKLLV